MKAKIEALGGMVIGTVGVAGSGLTFLTQEVVVPLWFLVMLVVVPTGELLSVLRGVIQRLPKQEGKNDG